MTLALSTQFRAATPILALASTARQLYQATDHANRMSCKLSMESVSASLLDTSSTSIA